MPASPMSVFARVRGPGPTTHSKDTMNFVKANPARVYAVAVAALALTAHFVPGIPTELVLGLVAAVLGLGEAVQRAENNKTAQASARAFAATYMCAKCPDTACAYCPLVR